MVEELVWIDGKLVGASEATVSVFDHGLTVGDGVFETLKAVDRQPFATRRHLERLRRSADGLGLQLPYTEHELGVAMSQVLASHDAGLLRVRITVTGGTAPLGSERGVANATVVVAAGPLAAAAPSTAVSVAPWPRNERGAMVGIKTTSYAENVVALAYAKARGATEAIFATTTDLLCEGTGSNIFVGVGRRLLTPPLSSSCLAGVTRDLVLEATDAIEED
ncbi:MAG: aminotransferase class IV, partial [Acidimicrobiales bacterium]